LALVAEPFASEKQPEFERHVETWKPGIRIQGDVGNVVYAVPAFLNNALDLG
jgi:hypothetical protein